MEHEPAGQATVKLGYVWYFPPRDIKEKEEFYLGILVGVLLVLLVWGCCFCFGILWEGFLAHLEGEEKENDDRGCLWCKWCRS